MTGTAPILRLGSPSGESVAVEPIAIAGGSPPTRDTGETAVPLALMGILVLLLLPLWMIAARTARRAAASRPRSVGRRATVVRGGLSTRRRGTEASA